MVQLMFSVWDVQAGAYARPFFAPARGLAVRSVSDEVNREGPENVIASHPQDFRLFELGSFDDVSGGFELHAQPVLLVDCASLKRVAV